MGSKLTDLTRITSVDTGDLIYIARTVGDTGVSAAMSRADFEDNLHVKLSLAQDTGKYLADSGFALSDSIITTLGRNLINDTGQTAMRSTLGFPVVTVDNTVPRFDGTTGSIQTSSVIITDTGWVGIGATAVDQFLTITGSVSGTAGVNCWIRNDDAGGLSSLATLSAASNNFNQFISFGQTSGLTRFGSLSSNGLNEFSAKGPLAIGSNNNVIYFATNGTVKGEMHASGGFSWGDTTDPGAGSLRITGSYTVAGVPVPQCIFATVQGTNVALTNNITTAQNIFAAANDTLTVAASTTYRFRALVMLNTGATSHTTAFGFGGTATITSCHYRASATSSAADTLATPQARRVSVATAAVLTAASTAVTTDIEIEGIIRINGAGTLIPQVTFSAGPTGTCEVVVDSFIEFLPIGSNTVAAAGSWA